MKYIRLLLLVLPLSACGMSSGTSVDNNKLASYKVGETPCRQITADQGSPDSKVSKSDGTIILSYARTHVAARPESYIPIIGGFVGGADSQINKVEFTCNALGTLQDINTTEATGHYSNF